MTALRDRFGVSERRACTVVGIHRSTMRLAPSPIHELNRAIALAERDGAEAGWQALIAIDTNAIPQHYHLWAAAAGELCRRRGAVREARTHFECALRDAPTDAERDFLRQRLESLL